MIDIIGILGGIFLVLGSYTLAKGKIWYSLMFYFFADLCWVLISIVNHAWLGSIFISIGIIFSLVTFYKMNKGLFYKDLNKKSK